MTEEENSEEKIEESKPEVQTQEDKPKVASKEEAVTAEEPKSTPEEQKCDPMTMNCEELGDHILGLVDKRIEYSEAIKKLDDIKEVLPSETIDKLYDETVEKKDKVGEEINFIVERAIVCRTLKPEETKEETSPELLEGSEEKTAEPETAVTGEEVTLDASKVEKPEETPTEPETKEEPPEEEKPSE